MKKQKKIQRKGVLSLILAGVVLAASDGLTQQTNQMDFSLTAINAYEAMIRADRAYESENWVDALAGYRNALEQYRVLRTGLPDWEPETVRYRMTYCVHQMGAIDRMISRYASEHITNSPPALSSDDEAYRERYLILRQENQYLRQRLVEIESDLPGLQPARSEPGEVEKLKKENEQLQKRLAALTTTNRTASTNDFEARVRKLNEERAALAKENERLKLELEKAKAEGSTHPPATIRQTEVQNILRKMHEGLAHERSGNFTAALDIYEQIISTRPSYVEALKAKGRCLLRQGSYDEASILFRSVVLTNRDDVPSRLLLSTTYCLAGKYNLAIEVLAPLIENNTSNARVQNAYGAAWMGLGDVRSAKVALEKAVSLDPNLADAHFNLAQVLLASAPENTFKAREHYRTALALGAQADENFARALGLL